MSRRSVPFIGESNGSRARAAGRGFAVLRVFADARTALRFTERVLLACRRFVDFAIVVTLRTRRLARSDDELKQARAAMPLDARRAWAERWVLASDWPTISR